MTKAGRPTLAGAITRIESKKRRVDADDLVAFAAVLGVNPSALLLPPVADDTPIEITGAGRVARRIAWAWVDGRRPLRIPADDDGTVRVHFQLRARPKGARRWNPLAPEGLGRQLHELAELGLVDPEALIEATREADGSMHITVPGPAIRASNQDGSPASSGRDRDTADGPAAT